MSFLKLLLPLSRKKKLDLENIRVYLDKQDFKKVKKLVKLGQIGIAYSSLKVSEKLVQDQAFPTLNLGIEDPALAKITKVWNEIIEQKVREN